MSRFATYKAIAEKRQTSVIKEYQQLLPLNKFHNPTAPNGTYRRESIYFTKAGLSIILATGSPNGRNLKISGLIMEPTTRRISFTPFTYPLILYSPAWGCGLSTFKGYRLWDHKSISRKFNLACH
jgi:hypothetical protein